MRNADPDRGAAPRLYIGGCDTGNLARLRADVGADDRTCGRGLVADEPPLDCTGPRSACTATTTSSCSRAEAPIEQHGHGRELLLPVRLRVPTTTCTPSGPMPDMRRARPPRPHAGSGAARAARGHRVLDGRQALGTVVRGVARRRDRVRWWRRCASVRRVPRRASTRFPTRAGRGFAAAATAGWAMSPSLGGRTRFYSTSATNRSSQRVTERLGLRYLGASFSLT